MVARIKHCISESIRDVVAQYTDINRTLVVRNDSLDCVVCNTDGQMELGTKTQLTDKQEPSFKNTQ